MIVLWTKPAEHDLKLIHSHIQDNNKPAALKVVSRIYNAVHTQLTIAPHSGRLGRVSKTRELVLSDIPYIIAYQVLDGKITVLRVLHTSLRWPNKF